MPLIQAIILEVTTLKAVFLPSLEVFRIPHEPSPRPPELSDQLNPQALLETDLAYRSIITLIIVLLCVHLFHCTL